jgi:hypothetical protein
MSVREKSARPFLPCIAAGAVGCAQVGPDFVPPRADVTETWQQIEGDALKPTAPELVEWWRVFDDPVLDYLVEATYRDNKSLEVAGLRVLEARAQLGIAVGNRYPQLQRGRGGAGAGAGFVSRMIMFVLATLYAVVAVTVFDRWVGAGKPATDSADHGEPSKTPA